MSTKTVTLDVREDLRRGREPFSKIMSAAAGLGDGEALRVIAPFEPVPLFGVLAQQGFAHVARAMADGSWEVSFTREVAATAAPRGTNRPPCPKAAGQGTPVVEVDARGLEPPQPLAKILQAVATLPADTRLRAYTDRRPMHLYPKLAERGFVGESEEQPDGSFITHICRTANEAAE